MKSKLFFLAVLSTFFILAACSKEEDEPVVKTTYTKDVKPIIVSSCTPCHVSDGANAKKYDVYATAKTDVDLILGRVNRDASAAGFMPKGGTKLSAETIAVISKWKTDGLLEN